MEGLTLGNGEGAKVMKKVFEEVIPIKPKPWSAPRFSMGRVWSANNTYEEKIKFFLRTRWQRPLLTGRVWLAFEFSGVSSGDLTNYVKAAEDALKGVIIKDDCQVCLMHAVKRRGGTSYVRVAVYTEVDSGEA